MEEFDSKKKFLMDENFIMSKLKFKVIFSEKTGLQVFHYPISSLIMNKEHVYFIFTVKKSVFFLEC